MSRDEFDEWLFQNHEHLRPYTAFEVARVALACGFRMRDIAPDVSSWVMVSRRKLALMSNPLMAQWVDVKAYQSGREWDINRP